MIALMKSNRKSKGVQKGLERKELRDLKRDFVNTLQVDDPWDPP